MACFTVRILQRIGILGPSAEDTAAGTVLVHTNGSCCIHQGCETIHQWWQQEGRFLAHFRLRNANRLTSDLRLVYTNLPESHDNHTIVVGRCQTSSASLPAAVPPHTSATTTTPDEIWQSFTRRFPVLALYQRA